MDSDLPSDSKPDLSLSAIRTASDAAPPPRILRTPSPSPSEVLALKQKGIFNFRASMARSSRRRKICVYSTLVIFLAITIVIAVLHNQIVSWLLPAGNVIKGWKGGWLIPIGVLAVMSFPPFVGHELIIIVVGVIWGLWIGLAITAAGTLGGEIANFFVFNTLCRARCANYEQKKIEYACLAQVLREGGLKVAIITRYTFIPTHFLTLVFATCGMRFWVFLVSAIVSLPRHFITVYIGVSLDDSANHVSNTKKEKIVTYVVLAATIVISVVALRYVDKLAERVKGDVIYRRRKSRQSKVEFALESLDRCPSVAATLEEPIALVQVAAQASSESYYQQGHDSEGVAEV